MICEQAPRACLLTSIFQTSRIVVGFNGYIYTRNRIRRKTSRIVCDKAQRKNFPLMRRRYALCCPRITIKITFVPFRAINVRPDDPIFTLAKELSAPSRLEISKINIERVQQTLDVLDQAA